MTQGDGTQGDGTADDRAAFRAFVREHHPDRGGDPELFVAGLARFRADPSSSGDDGSARYDAPIEVVAPLPIPTRVLVALIRTWRRRHSRRVL